MTLDFESALAELHDAEKAAFEADFEEWYQSQKDSPTAAGCSRDWWKEQYGFLMRMKKLSRIADDL